MAVPLQVPHTHTVRGDAAMNNNLLNKMPEGNVVKTIWIGESKIEFCDNFVARTPEDISRVQSDLYGKAWQIVNRLREDGVDI
ncbi:hypothetical protein [Paenibacillus sp. sgz500958]|uniref:hypothetical protein n=1 Tax=Paenibacillus sp. sgz500958 TaxID=3242475 RepID=UPI0036D32C4A